MPAQEINTYKSFQDKYLNKLKPNNVSLFLQDAISVEDLSSHASEMSHIASATEKSKSSM